MILVVTIVVTSTMMRAFVYLTMIAIFGVSYVVFRYELDIKFFNSSIGQALNEVFHWIARTVEEAFGFLKSSWSLITKKMKHEFRRD